MYLKSYNRKGVTLIEVLVVLSIIALLSTVSIISLLQSRSSFVLSAAVEVIDDNVTNAATDVLIGNFKQVSFSFNSAHFKSYLLTEEKELADIQKTHGATSISLDSYNELDGNFGGDIQFSWVAPVAGDDVNFLVKGVGKQLHLDTSSTSPQTFTPLNKAYSYQFSFKHPVTGVSPKQIGLYYFSSENISENSPVVLKAIEVQNFDDVWLPVSDLTVQVLGSPVKKQFVVSNQQYKSARLIFSQDDDEVTYEF
jgi:prepilin-type N-terminal cleavage/methylation domain-containing protein